MTETSVIPDAAAWQRLGRATGIAGMTTVVLLFVVLVGSRAEPPFDAPAAEFVTHYQAPNTVASPFRSFALTIALISFVWFAVALSILLRRAERGAVAVVDRHGLRCLVRGTGPVGERGRGRVHFR